MFNMNPIISVIVIIISWVIIYFNWFYKPTVDEYVTDDGIRFKATYDNKGNIQSYDNKTFSYEGRRLVKVDKDNPADKWIYQAYYNTCMWTNQGLNLEDGTYEAVGKHFQGNPYNLTDDSIIKHGSEIVEVERTFDGIKKYLSEKYIEGIVFWKDGEPKCKIKRSDFGFEWNKKRREQQ